MKKIKSKALNEKKIDQFQITGTQKLPPDVNLPTNPNLPTHHSDMVSFLFSNDGSTLARFFSRTPGINVEECRVSFSQSLAKKIVDILSSQFNYYPQKTSQQPEEKKDK
jgi:hypothetical protein